MAQKRLKKNCSKRCFSLKMWSFNDGVVPPVNSNGWYQPTTPCYQKRLATTVLNDKKKTSKTPCLHHLSCQPPPNPPNPNPSQSQQSNRGHVHCESQAAGHFILLSEKLWCMIFHPVHLKCNETSGVAAAAVGRAAVHSVCSWNKWGILNWPAADSNHCSRWARLLLAISSLTIKH